MSKQETFIDKSLNRGDGNRYPNLDVSHFFNPLEIGDFNAEGFDSVPSEDFDPGFGCVPSPKPYVKPELPPMIDRRTEADKERADYFFETDAESERKQDEFLKQYGI